MTTHLDRLAEWIDGSDSTVAFTGAGISTESGIPDFRSPGGVWARSQPVYFDELLRSAEARKEYWRQKSETHREFIAASPNVGHRTLAEWEARGRLRGVITQNIDGLHRAAGSRSILELHGTALFVSCLSCEARFDAGLMVDRFLAEGEPPACPECGGLTKHATVSFGQSLPPNVLNEAADWAQSCRVFLAIGSSLVVYPAAELPEVAKRHGARLVIVNRTATPLDSMADLVIRESIGETFAALEERLKG